MKPHKHAELIKAWADGAEIQSRYEYEDENGCKFTKWETLPKVFAWYDGIEYRIKPEPKEDLQYLIQAKVEDGKYLVMNHDIPRNLKVIFDGETGELKSAEVLK